MAYEIRRIEALPRTLAAVRATINLSELSTAIRPLFDEVWSFLHENGIQPTGHNAIYYASTEMTPAGEMRFDAYCGVEVHEKLPAHDRIGAVETPAGVVATAVHWGAYEGIPAVYDELRNWCAANRLEPTGASWEIYGDWTDDPSKLRTDVFMQIR
jgi:effector-binding domain-containing protein